MNVNEMPKAKIVMSLVIHIIIMHTNSGSFIQKLTLSQTNFLKSLFATLASSAAAAITKSRV
jgi:hypothetical protein